MTNCGSAVLLIFSALVQVLAFDHGEDYKEKLLIKPLSSGHVYSQFEFAVEKDVNVNTFKHFQLFPRLLGESILKNSVQELHFSLSQGLWRYEKWGYPYRDAPPGAELWAWFQNGTDNIDKHWGNLVNALSGQFCASLNFIDSTNTVIPRKSFRPEGAVVSDGPLKSTYARYAALPAEIVCTENLTPFKKLLPCNTMAGISTLLNAINLFNAHYISLALDFRTVCKNSKCTATAIELVQSVSVVFDPPVQQNGKQDWSFVKLFGCGLMSVCPLSSSTMLYVDASLNKTGVPFSLKSEPVGDHEKRIKENGNDFIIYDLQAEIKNYWTFNLAATYKSNHIYWIIPPPIIYVNRQITGYGQERGGIRCVFHNNHPTQSLKVLYMDVIPWYLRLYLHTLQFQNVGKTIQPDSVYYNPGKDRKRPNHLEVLLTIPADSKTEMTIEFDYVFLKWTEYPPDANHGFSVGPAIISTVVPTNKNFTNFPKGTSVSIVPPSDKWHFLRIHTEVLLVSLPTPDFSMPYNVICLSCTVVALAFGPIHNITTKNLEPVPEQEEGLIAKLKKRFSQLIKKCRSTEATEEGNNEPTALD